MFNTRCFMFSQTYQAFSESLIMEKIKNSVDLLIFLDEALEAVVPGVEFGSDKNLEFHIPSIVDIREGKKN